MKFIRTSIKLAPATYSPRCAQQQAFQSTEMGGTTEEEVGGVTIGRNYHTSPSSGQENTFHQNVMEQVALDQFVMERSRGGSWRKGPVTIGYVHCPFSAARGELATDDGDPGKGPSGGHILVPGERNIWYGILGEGGNCGPSSDSL